MARKIVSRAPLLEAGEVYAVPLLGHVGWTLVQVSAIREFLEAPRAILALFGPVHPDPPRADELAHDVPGTPVAWDWISVPRPRDWQLVGTWPIVDLPVERLRRYATGGRMELTERAPPPEPDEERYPRWIVQRRDDPEEAEYPYLCHAPYDLVDWETRLRATLQLAIDGDEHGLPWILEHRPWVISVSWKHHRQQVIDLSRTALGSIDLELTSTLEVVRLPPTVKTITVRVSDPDHLPTFEIEGRGVGASLEIVGAPLVALDGLEDVAQLAVRQMGHPFDDAIVSHYRAVETVRVERPAGSLECLTAWRRLRSLKIFGAIDVDPERFPTYADWERMDHMFIVELSRPAYERLIERLADGAYHLEFATIRSQKWIEQQAGNPFRNWGDRDPAVGNRATSLWKRVRKLDEAGEPREAVRSMVRGLNRMMRDFGVESAERDDAFEYACEIGARHGVEPRVITEWFDEGRDF